MSKDKMDVPTLGRMTEAEARAMLERIRWPDGPICPHCGTVGEATPMTASDDAKVKVREGVYNCRACRSPFSVTVGTVLEGSHIPLHKWVLAFFIFGSSKKGVSALQLQRQLGLGSYRTAWHMAHRVRHAMANSGFAPLSGIVEVDETYVGGKPRRYHGEPQKGKRPVGMPPRKRGRGSDKKIAVQVLVQRDGGARARAVTRIDADTLKPFIREHVAKSSAIHSDEFRSYSGLGSEFEGGHHTVAHGQGEYARKGGIHCNTAESFNGLFKRAVQGAWHHISREHIGRYLDEQVFRWSNRHENDAARTVRALKQVDGVRLYYRKPKGPDIAGEGLVAGS